MNRFSSITKNRSEMSNQSIIGGSPTCVRTKHKTRWFQRPWAILDTVLGLILLITILSAAIFGCLIRRKTKQIKNSPSFAQKLFLCFDVKDNLVRISRKPNDPQAIVSCLYGIRFLSMLWCILGHDYLIVMTVLTDAERFKRELRNSFFAQIITNFTLCVDTFFMLSGCLTAYSFFRGQKKNEDLSWRFWIRFSRHRLLRLWPAYAVTLFTIYTRLPYFMPHPSWPLVDPAIQCADSWWQNLLFLNTIWPNQCLNWTWYLGSDFIFFSVSPVFLVTLLKWKRLGLTILVLCGLASLACRAWTINLYNFPPTQMFWFQPTIYNMNVIENHFQIYIRPHTRVGTYLIGVWLGWYLAIHLQHSEVSKKVENRKTRNICSKFNQLFFWLLSFCAITVSVFGLWPALHEYDWPIYNLIYGTTHRVMFTAGVAWLVIACAQGEGGLLNSVLSCRVWVPLSNSSYGAYLLHLIIIIGANFMFMFPYEWKGHVNHLVFHFTGHLLVSYFCGLNTALTIEQPICRLEKLIGDKCAEKIDIRNRGKSLPMELDQKGADSDKSLIKNDIYETVCNLR